MVCPDIEESTAPTLSIREMTMLNATRKGRAVAQHYPDKIVLAADTLVALDGEVVGKPADVDDAVRILRRLNGCEHQVCTSVHISSVAQRRTQSLSVTSHVQFRELTDEQIFVYLAKIDPLDKAGAYAAQGHGAEIIRRIRGSYTNVVGLPMDETIAVLRGFGLHPLATAKHH